MINLKDNLISKRAKVTLEKKEFFKSDLLSSFSVVLDETDKILTAFYGKQATDFDFIFADVLARFAKNKKFSDLWSLNFRETENFLRDENHEGAFGHNLEEAQKSFLKMKSLLIASVSRVLLKDQLPLLIEEKSHWKNITLVRKNLWAQNLLSVFGWRLILCEEGLLTLTGAPMELTGEAQSEDLTALFDHVLEGNGVDLPVKVVAV